MYPTLFVIFGAQIGSYGVSKALAALAAWWLLSREFRRTGWDRDVAATLVMATTLVGFLGAKLYYLAEHAATLTVHDFGSSGFTWYGGFLAGAATFVVLARRHRLPLAPLAAVSAAPISVAYGIGRLGCLLAGDGTYGRPSKLALGDDLPARHGADHRAGAPHPTLRGAGRVRDRRVAVGGQTSLASRGGDR
jgi:phosphatidylglycerol:prolipoprotein diacylglycerol transferase